MASHTSYCDRAEDKFKITRGDAARLYGFDA
jgi:hypothetical protein